MAGDGSCVTIWLDDLQRIFKIRAPRLREIWFFFFCLARYQVAGEQRAQYQKEEKRGSDDDGDDPACRSGVAIAVSLVPQAIGLQAQAAHLEHPTGSTRAEASIRLLQGAELRRKVQEIFFFFNRRVW